MDNDDSKHGRNFQEDLVADSMAPWHHSPEQKVRNQKFALTVTTYAININQLIGGEKQLCMGKKQLNGAFPGYAYKVLHTGAKQLFSTALIHVDCVKDWKVTVKKCKH